MNKKQIIFIEPAPSVYIYRIARSLKLTGKYETVLISFSEIDKEFYSNAYNKILIFKLSHKIRLEKIIDLFKQMTSKKGRNFFNEIKEMEPYIFQITGPDLFSLIILSILRKNKRPKIYYANDIWGVEKRGFLFKKYGLKGEFQRLCERICFKMVDGIFDKHSLEQFGLLKYKVSIPKISLPPYPLDEWIFPAKKKNKEVHIVYAGGPFPSRGKNISFIDIIKIITSQKINLHSYGPCSEEKDNPLMLKESQNNRYYHFHGKVSPYALNKEMSSYDYGILPEFWDQAEIDSNPGIIKTEMCTRIINYIEAGLPIIISRQNESMVKVVDKYGLGIPINFRDLPNLRKILKTIDYKKLQRNIKDYQEKFKLSKRVREIEEFYENIAELKKEKINSITNSYVDP